MLSACARSVPACLRSLYNGHVHLWNFQSQTLLKTFEVTELPVRCSKFIARKQWIVCILCICIVCCVIAG